MISGCADGNCFNASTIPSIPTPFTAQSLNVSIACRLLIQSVPTSAKFVPCSDNSFTTSNTASALIGCYPSLSGAPVCMTRSRRLISSSILFLLLLRCVLKYPAKKRNNRINSDCELPCERERKSPTHEPHEPRREQKLSVSNAIKTIM